MNTTRENPKNPESRQLPEAPVSPVGANADKGPGKSLERWYVVQVSTGGEDKMCNVIAHACAVYDEQHPKPEDRVWLRECFCPKFSRRRKRMGEWKDVANALLPGYVIAVTRNPDKLADAIRPVQQFCRVLTINEMYSALDDRERAWLEGQTAEGNRTIPLSFGAKEGGKLVVTEGPLQGREALITKLDRTNCIAHVEFHAGQITFKTTIGLVIMPSGTVRQTTQRS